MPPKNTSLINGKPQKKERELTMAMHPNFRGSLYEILPPELRGTAYKKLLPPQVAKVSERIEAWRYVGASAISRATSSICCVSMPLAPYRPTWSMRLGRFTLTFNVIEIFGNNAMTLVPVDVA